MKKNRKYLAGGIFAAVAGAAMVIVSAGANAADFPERDITFVVPYSPGGGSDQQVRRLHAGLEEALGVGIQIVYKTGGGGAVGFLDLHSSAPDGNTIANVVVPNIIVAAQGDDVGFKPEEFSYIGMTDQSVGAIVVANDSNFATIEDSIEYAKENPGKLTVAGVGASGLANYALMVDAFDIDATYVPVSGGLGSILPLLQGGHVDIAILSSSHAVLYKDTVRAILVTGEKSPALPDVPNSEEAGYPNFVFGTTWGIMAPPGTPDDIVAILNAAVNKAVADPAVRKQQVDIGVTPVSMTPEEARELVLRNVAVVDKQIKLIDELGLK